MAAERTHMAQPPDSSSAPPDGNAGPPARTNAYARSQFMVVKIPIDADTDDRIHQREERIDEALRAKGLGSVLGWGGSYGSVSAGGSRRVAFTRVDLDVVDVGVVRAELQMILAGIGAPAGTEIHYSLDGTSLADVYAPPDWRPGQPISWGPEASPGRRRR
jgi:hypothetical protein